MLTTDQLAKKLGVSGGRIRQLLTMNRITHGQKIGRDWVFTEHSRILTPDEGRKRTR